ncbi:hypothetical protein [Sphingomonas jatrophae]|uniref:Uncharacterized protein n=1 Tax=Sphingomonas jatrophae TaxID=1166337 RepID=A0A1I6JQI9_9SPHN|nr:hypothetical protein [Sphingomonas jatrophae]SFR81246.1 hypothetical protein SAMN05192580_0682 [Sphingomonas jatrophae]
MNARIAVSVLLAAANLAAALWIIQRYGVGSGATFLAIIAAVIVSAIVQRLRFGRETGWRARFDPVVVLGFLIGFDLVLAIAIAVRG